MMKTLTVMFDLVMLLFCFLGAIVPKQLAQVLSPIKFVQISVSKSGYAILFAICLWGLGVNLLMAAGAGLLLWLAARATRSSSS
ncbi:hypothetical protein BH10CYA1_BH10CYA1_18150 [soil metagenome]